ncbi:hypothetical protein EKO04_001300 [Ascochyta lentis]|uniref:Uncharacterized protein n=1 Tax=Ascochyta lentis TaxID=205686 RepID=A0A8H7J8T0_9PLEO|nr:hypothetical protein EKO04_001300 [Ascochyta lentis]
MVKEKTVQLNELPALECDFSWDTEKLQASIRTYKSDYDPQDPWTWPRLHSTQHSGYVENGHGAVNLPQGIAYPREVAQQFARPGLSTKCASWMKQDNIFFPFSYDGSGQLRAEDALAACDRWNWIKKVTGTHPAILEVEAEPEPERPESTIDAFNEVIRMVNETSYRDSAEVEVLRKELSQLKALHFDLTARADEAERQLASANKAHKEKIVKVRHEARNANDNYTGHILGLRTQILKIGQDLAHAQLQLVQQTKRSDSCENQLSAAEARIKTLEHLQEERDQKVKDSEKEAATAREQVMEIWAEMKKLEDAGRKKKRSEDASECQMKKVKYTCD